MYNVKNQKIDGRQKYGLVIIVATVIIIIVVIITIPCVCVSITVGCEYGDKAPWCATYVRGRDQCERSEVAELCCHRCGPYLNNQPNTTTTTTTSKTLSSLLSWLKKSFSWYVHRLCKSEDNSNDFMKVQDGLSWVMWSKWAETRRCCVRRPQKLYNTFPGAAMFLILDERLFRGQLCRVIETSPIFSMCHRHYRASWASIMGLLGPLLSDGGHQLSISWPSDHIEFMGL